MGSAASVCGPCFRKTNELNAKESVPIAINCPLDVFTPRDAEGEEGFEIGEDFLVDTPNGKDRAVFKYFCPMCFLHYKEHKRVLRCSQCCSHIICVGCAGDYLQTKGLPAAKVATASQITSTPQHVLAAIACPNCASSGFFPECITESESVYSYFASPHKNTTVGSASPCGPPLVYNSPVKIGDDFDSLKRKMIKFSSPTPEELNIVQDQGQDQDSVPDLDLDLNEGQGQGQGQEGMVEGEEGRVSVAKSLSLSLDGADQSQDQGQGQGQAVAVSPLAAALVAGMMLEALSARMRTTGGIGPMGPGSEPGPGHGHGHGHGRVDADMGRMLVGV